MLNASIKSETLKNAISAISALQQEAVWEISPDGIRIKAVDPAHVAMVTVVVGADAFEHFDCTQCEIGIDLEKLAATLKLTASSDIVGLSTSDDARLIVRAGTITRRTNLIDISSLTCPKTPSLDLPAKAALPASDIQRLIKAVDKVSDHISITMGDGRLFISADGDTDAVSMELSESDVEDLTSTEPTTAMYPLDYMATIFKAIPPASMVSLSIGTDLPIVIEYAPASFCEVSFMLAPRIESE